MNYRHAVTTTIGKFLASFLTIAFSLVAFAHGQSCTLLPGWNPSTLADGQSRTGYKIPEATYTQSCTSAIGIITCTHGSLGNNGNIYRYQSCIPHTWANCTTPLGASHLEYKTLYKSNKPTINQTCPQLSQNLQCLNGVFTGGITPWLYTYATCAESNRAQCIDIRTNTYKDHLQTIFAYTTPQVMGNQSCNAVRKTLQCINGTWSGGNQNSLYSGCSNNGNGNGNSGNGKSCTLLPDWFPSTLADGQSRTGYQIAEATYSQSCAGAAGVITCVDGSVANGNIFKYPSCIPHTWAKCTTPTGANNLEFRMLYKSAQATYTQTCQQISQNLQCLNGVFTGGVTPWLYTFASCTDPNRAQCVDLRTNSYKDHGETVIGYAAKRPGIGQTCATLQKTLTCTNGTRSGGNQAALSTGCTDPSSFSGCANTRVSPAITVPHGSSLNAYTSPEYFGTGTCDNILKPLTCINGTWSGGNQASLYSGCVQGNTKPCFNIIAGTGTLLHGSFITKYTKQFAFEALKESCSQFDVSQQCNNGVRSGGSAQYTGCQNVASGSCLDSSTNIYTPNFQSIIKYTIGSATSTVSCEQSKKSFTCVNGVRSGANPSSYPYPTCGGCKLPRGTTVSEGWYGSGYSVTSAIFPKTCEKNYSTALSCSGGILNGNRQTYQYPSDKCEDIGGLVDGIDLALNDSPGFPGTPNDIGYLVAQGSSPQISILFKNNGKEIFNKSITKPGFLTCTRHEQNLKIYESKPITSFVVNPGTKVGINIRLSSLFTQALGTKVVDCKLYPDIVPYDDKNTANDGRTATVEIVKADRFDLALSTSIDPISKNLEAAEGATGTQGVQNFLFNKIMNVLVPLVIILGILSAILGFYKIMFSTEDTATKEGTRYIIFGVIGIILIMSSKFIGQNVFSLLNPSSGEIKGFEIASGLYNQILYPFIKFAIYLVIGAMFVILVSRVITFLFGTDADAQKKAGTLIGWNVISMLIIIGAKQIVEAIYGEQKSVVKDITNLGEVGSGVLADKNIPILYQVINYALGIASLVILVIIIIQTVKLLMKPDDPAQLKNIKNSLLYMLIGILVLGAGYLIVNFAIIN